MCVRIAVWDIVNLGSRFMVEDLPEAVGPRYNAAPGQNWAVVSNDGKKNEMTMKRFGLIPVWAKDEKMGYKLLNTRAETIFDKPMWKSLAKNKRCIVPANGFYEWTGDKKNRQPYFFHLKKQELFSIAGLMSSWTNKSTGEVIDSFSIITTSPNKDMKPIHDRMPVILHKQDEADWLNPENSDEDDITELLLPYDDGKLELHPVSTEVNKVANDNPKLIDAVKLT